MNNPNIPKSTGNVEGGPTTGTIDPVITKKIPYIRKLTIYADPPAATAGKKLIDLTLATTKFVDINVDANGIIKTNTYVGKTMKVHFKDIPGYDTPADYTITVPECVEYYVRGTYKAQVP